MHEVTFESHLLEDGHLSCPRKYASPDARFRVIASLPGEEPAPPTTRPFGLCKGEFIVPDDFDAPLPDDIVKAFEGQ